MTFTYMFTAEISRVKREGQENRGWERGGSSGQRKKARAKPRFLRQERTSSVSRSKR